MSRGGTWLPASQAVSMTLRRRGKEPRTERRKLEDKVT